MRWLSLSLACAARLSQTALGGEVEKGSALSAEVSAVAEWIWDARERRSAWLAEISPTLELDLGEAGVADDWYLFAKPTLTWGTEEAYEWKLRLYQAWLSWDGNDTFNVQVGALDPSWHFHSLPSSWPFVRLPARTAGQFSPGGLGRLDLFPLSAPGVRLEWKPRADFYVQAEALSVGSGWALDGADLTRGTSLTIVEAGLRRESDTPFRAGAGGWLLGRSADLRADGRTVGGVYAFADAGLRPAPHELSAFLTAAATRTTAARVQTRVAAGLHATGVFPARQKDETALAAVWEELPGEAARFATEVLHRCWLRESFYLQTTALWQRQDREEGWRFGVAVGWNY